MKFEVKHTEFVSSRNARVEEDSNERGRKQWKRDSAKKRERVAARNREHANVQVLDGLPARQLFMGRLGARHRLEPPPHDRHTSEGSLPSNTRQDELQLPHPRPWRPLPPPRLLFFAYGLSLSLTLSVSLSMHGDVNVSIWQK